MAASIPAMIAPKAAWAAAHEEARAVVDSFYLAYSERDAAGMNALLAEDVRFETPALGVRVVGRTELAELAREVLVFTRFEVGRYNTIVSPPWVATQQWIHASRHRWQLRVHGAAVFEVTTGRIARWYDYGALLEVQRQWRTRLMRRRSGRRAGCRFGSPLIF